ncbi:MAG: prepilin-type N-terminal cleavage/methylation domain-containing protein [Gemmataceae bacterium]|nr:prepilin-type N-terminal cleavage/methylation domain-containing protein [Gemmataceae bacterium]
MNRSVRQGKTLIELLVVIGIVSVLIGLCLSAVGKVYFVALAFQSKNNLRQITMASLLFAHNQKGLLRMREDPGTHVFSPHVWMLPYLNRPYPQVIPRPDGFSVEVVYQPIPEYRDPADYTLAYLKGKASEFIVGPTLCSYPCNAQCFRERNNLNRSFMDGLSNTVAFGQQYAVCEGDWLVYTNLLNTFSRYTERAATFADDTQNPPDIFPVTDGKFSKGSEPGPPFLVRPRYAKANRLILNTPHPSGLSVSMFDGSVRTLGAGMDPRIYWALLTPAGSDTFE